MTIANDIIQGRVPDFDFYIRSGETLDDIDEYGFTPLIECAITRQVSIAELLIAKGVQIDKSDSSGRTALHWAVDNNDIDMARLLLVHGADANAYTNASMPVLVYPILRAQDELKHLLYQYGAKLDFALDFVYGKLLGHRFELLGDVDIVNARGEFVELDYEGFILEFTVAILKDSLRRYTSSYSTKHLRRHFPYLHTIMDGFAVADELLRYQHHPTLSERHEERIAELMNNTPLLILPAASRGHAIGFVRFHAGWAKIDRGENSLKEGSVNVYQITRPNNFSTEFLIDFLYKRHPREYFQKEINQWLGLNPLLKIPMSSQIAGNCSWANIQAIVPVAYTLQKMAAGDEPSVEQAKKLYQNWVEWDKDRALDECIQRFYAAAEPARKASFAAMLGAVLFHACDYNREHDIERAEKILTILTLPEYNYILESYLEIYCVKRLTRKGNNLLKILDDCGINPKIGVTPIATGLKPREEK